MPKSLAPCGTFSAYRRHLRRDELVDDACREAANAEARGRRAAKREKQTVRVPALVPSAPAPDGAGPAPAAADGPIDEIDELRAMYGVLKAHMQEAPPQSIAAIVRQADAVLVRITEIEGREEKSEGGLLDGVPIPDNVFGLPGTHLAS